eukprot:1902707-Ditylum_brightwellii.AAC.1
MKHSLESDKANGDTMWQDAMVLGVNTLYEMDCCEYQDLNNIQNGGYQCITLHMVFACKQDLRRKAILVVRGHLIDLPDNKVYFSMVKWVIVK